MKTVDRMLIFDVDGVITNPSEKKITEPEILDFIVERLEKGEPVALNTGRSLAWLIERVINPLIEKAKRKTVMQNFFAVGEKGGVWLTIDKNEKIIQHRDETITIPKSLQNQIRTLIKSKYSKSMFYDESKMGTMLSTEMKDGFPIDEYRQQQDDLVRGMKDTLEANNLSRQLKIDPTTIAVDIENKQVGKGFAIQRIVEWLKEKGIEPQRFTAFGDSSSDVPMAEKLYEMNCEVELVFVGGKEKLGNKAFPFPVIFTKGLYGKGTLELLKTL